MYDQMYLTDVSYRCMNQMYESYRVASKERTQGTPNDVEKVHDVWSVLLLLPAATVEEVQASSYL